MKKALFALALLSLLGCQPPSDFSAERGTIIILAKRLARLEKKTRMRVPVNERIYIYEVPQQGQKPVEANRT